MGRLRPETALPHLIESFADMAPFVALRRDLHAHPELGFEEHRTSAIVAERLASWGVEVHTGLAGTGVVGVVHGRHTDARHGTRTIGLRADLDTGIAAQPLQEKSLAYIMFISGSTGS